MAELRRDPKTGALSLPDHAPAPRPHVLIDEPSYLAVAQLNQLSGGELGRVLLRCEGDAAQLLFCPRCRFFGSGSARNASTHAATCPVGAKLRREPPPKGVDRELVRAWVEALERDAERNAGVLRARQVAGEALWILGRGPRPPFVPHEGHALARDVYQRRRAAEISGAIFPPLEDEIEGCYGPAWEASRNVAFCCLVFLAVLSVALLGAELLEWLP